MNKRERVIAAMNGKEVDHVPAGFWFHFNGGDAAGDACVQAHLNYYRETDLDFVKIMCDGYFPFPLPEINCPADGEERYLATSRKVADYFIANIPLGMMPDVSL